MGRFWSLLFLCVPVLGVAVFVVAAMPNSWPLYDHWLPKDISESGHVIDSLFYFILYLTGIIFVGTSVVLFWYMWKYDGQRHTEPVEYTHGNHTLEVVWSILPAATLLFISVVQLFDMVLMFFTVAIFLQDLQDDIVESSIDRGALRREREPGDRQFAGIDGVICDADFAFGLLDQVDANLGGFAITRALA